MTRKTPSPMIESDLMIECDHMRMKKMSRENLNQQDENSMNYSVNGGDNNYNSNNNNNSLNSYNVNINNINNNTNNNNINSNNSDSIVISPMKRLTSFEEIAKKSESNSLLYIHEMDNNYSTSTSTSRSKPRSDYNICYNYKNLDAENDDGIEFPSLKHQMMIKKSTSHSYNLRRTERKHSSSDNSPFDYDLLREKRKDNRFVYDENGRAIESGGGAGENSIKSYDRFFNSDDEIDEEYERRYNNRKKTTSSTKYRSHVSGTEADDDENSSNSPPLNKSITPLNECIPLLSYDAETTVIYQSAAPPAPIGPPITASTSGSLRQQKTSRIPMRIGSNRKNSSISSPESDKSDGYQTTINRFEKAQQSTSPSKAYQSISPSHNINSNSSNHSSRKSSTKSNDNNKIRIKINQQNNS